MTTPQPTWNSTDAIGNAIQQYRMQYEQAVQAITNLDQQRVQLVKTTDTLVGAIAALEQLLKNEHDENESAKQAAEAKVNADAKDAATPEPAQG